MTDRPILFSAPMVLSFLAGRKFETRRLAYDEHDRETIWHRVMPGDRLWVRENFWHASPYPGTLPSGEPDESRRWSSRLVHYAAGGDPPNCANRHYGPHGFRDGSGAFAAPDPWAMWLLRPCIHMPRWASRITLTVKKNAPQLLQDITPEEAIAEGLEAITKDGCLVKYGIPDRDGLPGSDDFGWDWQDWCVSPVDAYAALWRRLHGRESWDANPHVIALHLHRRASQHRRSDARGMTSGRSDIIDVAGELRHETDRAYLIFDGTKEVWLPKKLVEYDAGEGTFAMPEWLAGEKGLI